MDLPSKNSLKKEKYHGNAFLIDVALAAQAIKKILIPFL